MKASLYSRCYAEGTTARAHLRSAVAARQHSSKETSQRWLKKMKASLYSRCYAEGITARAHLRSAVAARQHSSKETSQRWLAVGDSVSDFINLRIEPASSRTDNNGLNI